MKIYNANSSCSQLVFCDYSTPKSEHFSVYDKHKEFLLAEGVPEKEIAFIHSYHTEQRKLELFRKANSSEIWEEPMTECEITSLFPYLNVQWNIKQNTIPKEIHT